MPTSTNVPKTPYLPTTQPRHNTNQVPTAAKRGSPATALSKQKIARLARIAPTPIKTMKVVDADTPNIRAGNATAQAGHNRIDKIDYDRSPPSLPAQRQYFFPR